MASGNPVALGGLRAGWVAGTALWGFPPVQGLGKGIAGIEGRSRGQDAPPAACIRALGGGGGTGADRVAWTCCFCHLRQTCLLSRRYLALAAHPVWNSNLNSISPALACLPTKVHLARAYSSKSGLGALFYQWKMAHKSNLYHPMTRCNTILFLSCSGEEYISAMQRPNWCKAGMLLF